MLLFVPNGNGGSRARAASRTFGLGEDPCATLMRAHLKDIVLEVLQNSFTLGENRPEDVALRLFGSTLIRASSASFPFSDRKSEDLDLEIWCRPGRVGPAQAIKIYADSLELIHQILAKANIKITPTGGESVAQSIVLACDSHPLRAISWTLELDFQADYIPLICGVHAAKRRSNVARLECSITPPNTITVLTPPSTVLDKNVRSRNPALVYDRLVHYVSKVLARSVVPTACFVPDLTDPSGFRPTDIMNLFNLLHGRDPRLFDFKIGTARPHPVKAELPTNPASLLEQSDDLVAIRFFTLCNLVVFGYSLERIDRIDLKRLDPHRPGAAMEFGEALAPFLGRGDVLVPKKLQAMLSTFLQLFLEAFPPTLPGTVSLGQNLGLTLFPEERAFIHRVHGNVRDGVVVRADDLVTLLNGRYGRSLENYGGLASVCEALKHSATLRKREEYLSLLGTQLEGGAE